MCFAVRVIDAILEQKEFFVEVLDGGAPIPLVDRCRTVHWYTNFGGLCALHPAAAYGLVVLGVLSGLYAGRVWWRWVYVEGKRWKRFPFRHE